MRPVNLMVISRRRLTLHRFAMQSVAPTMGYNKDRADDFAQKGGSGRFAAKHRTLSGPIFEFDVGGSILLSANRI
jgi:hypothetical protein